MCSYHQHRTKVKGMDLSMDEIAPRNRWKTATIERKEENERKMYLCAYMYVCMCVCVCVCVCVCACVCVKGEIMDTWIQ